MLSFKIRKRRRGFSLIEMMFAMGILGLVLSLTLAEYGRPYRSIDLLRLIVLEAWEEALSRHDLCTEPQRSAPVCERAADRDIGAEHFALHAGTQEHDRVAGFEHKRIDGPPLDYRAVSLTSGRADVGKMFAHDPAQRGRASTRVSPQQQRAIGESSMEDGWHCGRIPALRAPSFSFG